MSRYWFTTELSYGQRGALSHEISFISLQCIVYEIFAFAIFTPFRKFANSAPDDATLKQTPCLKA